MHACDGVTDRRLDLLGLGIPAALRSYSAGIQRGWDRSLAGVPQRWRWLSWSRCSRTCTLLTYLLTYILSSVILEFQDHGVACDLAEVARGLLAMPATSTSSERSFSLAGRTVDERWTQLEGAACTWCWWLIIEYSCSEHLVGWAMGTQFIDSLNAFRPNLLFNLQINMTVYWSVTKSFITVQHTLCSEKHPLLFSCITLRTSNQFEWKFHTK